MTIGAPNFSAVKCINKLNTFCLDIYQTYKYNTDMVYTRSHWLLFVRSEVMHLCTPTAWRIFPGNSLFTHHANLFLRLYVMWDYIFEDKLYENSQALFSCRSLLGVIPGNVLFLTLSLVCGMFVFAHYAQKGCDPKLAGDINNYNQVSELQGARLLSWIKTNPSTDK